MFERSALKVLPHSILELFVRHDGCTSSRMAIITAADCSGVKTQSAMATRKRKAWLVVINKNPVCVP